MTSVFTGPFRNFADVTLTDDDSNLILVDDANREFRGDGRHLDGGGAVRDPQIVLRNI